MLARAALNAGDLARAQRYALQLAPSSRREDLLGKIALAHGNRASADLHFIAADDIFAVDREVDDLSRSDPRAAYRLELLLNRRLARTLTHPDALAESSWKLGVLAAHLGERAQAMDHYRDAVRLSPLSAKYLIFAGFQAYDLQHYADARSFFVRAIGVDPGSADAYAGAGMAAFRLGDRAAAMRYARRSRTYDPHSEPLQTLDRLLQ
jgi:tetratricopeptide (TPR) repeat protein